MGDGLRWVQWKWRRYGACHRNIAVDGKRHLSEQHRTHFFEYGCDRLRVDERFWRNGDNRAVIGVERRQWRIERDGVDLIADDLGDEQRPR